MTIVNKKTRREARTANKSIAARRTECFMTQRAITTSTDERYL